jgi:hypothetical protein
MKEEGRLVLWIGLAAMSNVRGVLMHGGVIPDAIVQSGGSPGRADSVVQCDASACSSLLQLSLDYGIPLTFVTTDTGESPSLRWLDDLRSGDSLELKDAAVSLAHDLQQFRRVRELVTACTLSHPSLGLPRTFEGESFLHAPLTLFHALSPYDSFLPLPVVSACVKCDSLIPASICCHGKEMQWCKECWGRWSILVDRRKAEAAAVPAWWLHSRMFNSHYRDASLSSGDDDNCSVTVGWLSEETGLLFRAALVKLLSAEPPA